MIKVIYPERISLRLWADALVADYFNENLPILDNENNWQKWADQVAGTGVFLAAAVPSPIFKGSEVYFKKWDDWAKTVYIVMSNESNK